MLIEKVVFRNSCTCDTLWQSPNYRVFTSMANCSVQIHAETAAFELPAIVMRSGLCSQASRIAKEFLRTFAH